MDSFEVEKYTPEEYLKSVTSTTKINPGIGIGKLRIGETRGEYLFSENINVHAYSEMGISLQYKNADTLIGIRIDNEVIYETAEGKKIGLTEKEIVASLGEPESRGVKISKSLKQIGTLPSLNYPGMMITFDNDGKRLIHLFREE